MRRHALLLVALFLASSATAQTMVWEDDDNDVVLRTSDGSISQPDPTGHPDVDLVEGGIWEETEEDITFYLTVKNIEAQSQSPTPFSDPNFYYYFAYDLQNYRLVAFTAMDNPFNAAVPRPPGFVQLQAEFDDGRFRPVADGELGFDFGTDQIFMTVPRNAIVNENQAPLAINSTLTGFRATADSMGWFEFPLFFGPAGGGSVGVPQAYDVAPDLGFGADYVMQTGPSDRRGNLVAVSEDPVRWTNGEASTLSYEVIIRNVGETDIAVAATMADIPENWVVAYSDSFSIRGGEAVTIPVLVTIPFGHNHGELKWFGLQVESDDGKHTAGARLGVYWPTIPQPAGHHNRIWLHSAADDLPAPFNTAFAGIHSWMSAAETEDADAGLPIPAQFAAPPTIITGTQAEANWFIRLEPALRMGMDFRREEMGSMTLTVSMPAPVVDPVVTVRLIHSTSNSGMGGGQQWTVLAEGTSETAPGIVSGTRDFEIPLAIQTAADNVPYNPEANLQIMVELVGTFMVGAGFVNPQQVAPSILPGTSVMELPLNEFIEPVNLAFQTGAGLELLPGMDGQEKLVNPGRTAVYEFTLVNNGTASRTVDVLLTGSEWGRVLGDKRLVVEAGTERTIALAVTAPENAVEGDVADITVTVTNINNAAARTGVTTRTTVTESADIPDELARSEELEGTLSKKKKAPGLPLVGLAIALVVAARRR